ncbi:MAG TPA: hypothetical protein VFZ65_03965, partial [Planctomycetota bacterium]|nr:hypothetical protein [Planctomycetota bacterium]
MTNHSAVLSSCLAAGAAFAAFGARVLAQEEVVLRSTAGQGITVVSSSATFSAFNAAFFAAAAASPQLAVEVSYPAWLVALPADAASRWLSPASGSSANFVLTQTFTIPASVIDYASLEFTFAVDDFLGDPTGPNHWGVFLNGHEVNGMHGSGHSAQQQLLAGGVGGLLAPGPNLLQVYCRDTGGTVSGVIYRARIRYWPCVAEEVIRLHSGNGPIGGPDGEVL